MKDEFEDSDVLEQMRDVLIRALNKAKEQYPDLKPYELKRFLPDTDDVIKLLKQFFPDIEYTIMNETDNDVMLEHLEELMNWAVTMKTSGKIIIGTKSMNSSEYYMKQKST